MTEGGHESGAGRRDLSAEASLGRGGGDFRRMVVAIAVAAACGVGLLLVGMPEAFSPVGQWDFEAYYYGLKVYDAGGNPWNPAEVVKAADRTVYPFLYPHHTFAFFRLFAFDDIGKAKDVYLAARLACLAALVLLWTYGFVAPGARGWFLAFVALAGNAAVCRDLVIGNVSIFEQTLLWFGLFALLRGRPGIFCGLVILASQFKLLPVCLVALVLVTGDRRKWLFLVGSGVACVLIVVGVYLSNPWAAKTFAQLTWSEGAVSFGGQMNPCSLPLFREAADAVLSAWGGAGDLRSKSVANVAYAVFVAVVVGVYAWRIWRGMPPRRALLVGILTYVLIAPQMKDYSYIITLVPTFELIRERISRPGSVKWLAVGAALVLTLPGLSLFWHYRPLLLAAWAWLVGVGSVRESPFLQTAATTSCATSRA